MKEWEVDTDGGETECALCLGSPTEFKHIHPGSFPTILHASPPTSHCCLSIFCPLTVKFTFIYFCPAHSLSLCLGSCLSHAMPRGLI